MADASEQPPAPAPPPPESRPAAGAERPGWRSRPLAKRLPLLILAALGLWLWRVTGTPERELVFQLEGPGWGDVRAIDLQVMGGEDGQLLKREERFFASGPPPEVTFKVDLPEGPGRALLFLKREGQAERVRLVQDLTVGEEQYIVRQLRLPPASR